MTIRGATGELRWRYLPAAVFGPWQLVTDSAGGTLTADLVSVDRFRASQAPLTVVVPLGRRSQSWRVLTLQMTGTSLTATVSPLERVP